MSYVDAIEASLLFRSQPGLRQLPGIIQVSRPFRRPLPAPFAPGGADCATGRAAEAADCVLCWRRGSTGGLKLISAVVRKVKVTAGQSATLISAYRCPIPEFSR